MSASPNHFSIRPEWLALHDEAALEPERPVVDAHHHLYDRPGLRYLLDEYLQDTDLGHNLRASVFVQARAMLRQDAPPNLQPIGEAEFVNGVAAISASGLYGSARICAGIVGFADLTLAHEVAPVLERLIMAGGGAVEEGGRFCGIRQTLCWDKDTLLLNPAYPTTADMMESEKFLTGFGYLSRFGLSFEAWSFFHQLDKVADLARRFPETPIVLNHCGGILRIRDYAERPDIYAAWKAGISNLATCPNVMVKLSGLGMRISGFDFDRRETPPSSDILADAWRPWVEHCLEAFGPDRVMYGSNFPVDKGSYSFKVGLNALKKITRDASEEAKDSIFWRSAQRFYRLPDGLIGA
ncbi:MAG: amidohydrolase family protein [Sphingomonadaceae bacterium]